MTGGMLGVPFSAPFFNQLNDLGRQGDLKKSGAVRTPIRRASRIRSNLPIQLNSRKAVASYFLQWVD